MAEAAVEDWKKLTPIPLILNCPSCGARHVDVDEFATKVHRDHSCQKCGLTWRAAQVPTVGVVFLPGYKNYQGLITKPCEICDEPVEDVDDPNFKGRWLCGMCHCHQEGRNVKTAFNEVWEALKILSRGEGPKLTGVLREDAPTLKLADVDIAGWRTFLQPRLESVMYVSDISDIVEQVAVHEAERRHQAAAVSKDLLRCGFCKKTEREVKSLVAARGQKLFICDECVGTCVKLLDARDTAQRCTTCNQSYKAGEVTTCSNPFHLCRDCTYENGVVVRSCANCDH